MWREKSVKGRRVGRVQEWEGCKSGKGGRVENVEKVIGLSMVDVRKTGGFC